jgi:S1-C subfamily serine protease
MEETVFPIVTYNPKTNKWKCLGTGFFINPVGAFVTAKHLLFSEGKIVEPTLLGIQKISQEEYHVREVNKLSAHNNSDLMIGKLGKRRKDFKGIKPELSKYSVIDFETLKIDDEIYTYSFPNTTSIELNEEDEEYTFKGTYSKGKIIDYHQNGTSKLKNRCFQTNMKIDGGSSGGPVFKNGYIVAINSTSFNLSEDDEPISFITPIDYILDLFVIEDGKKITIKQLIEQGNIKTKN